MGNVPLDLKSRKENLNANKSFEQNISRHLEAKMLGMVEKY